LQPLWWDRQAILLKSEDITFYGLADVLHGLLLGFSLADATGQAGAFNYPIAVFAGIEDDLTHGKDLTRILARGSYI
jgi:hypothetical protein